MSDFATVDATAAYEQRFPNLPFYALGRTGLRVSAAGFGSYRVSTDNTDHHFALSHALKSGINLIDTSANYTDGESERLIGQVLAQLEAGGILSRQQIVLVTKGGYLQGENFALSQQRKAAENPFPELVEYSAQLEHCIHPEFLEDQILRSRSRLGVDCLDVYLLHNPEYYLGWCKKFDIDLDEARREYYRRLEQAMRHLEKEVARGRIASYGISSNSFPNSPDSYDFTSLERIWEIANSISADHHFSVIQMPMNLLETGGGSLFNQPSGQSVLQFAVEHNLGVLINRPLNAVVGNNLVRLATPPTVEGSADRDVVEAHIDNLVNQEARLQRAVFAIDIPFRTKQEFAATTAAGTLLQQRWEGFGTFSNWRDVSDGYLRPRMQFALQFLRTRPELPPEATEWIDAYEQSMLDTLREVASVYRAYEAGMLSAIRSNASAADSQWGAAKTLSRIAIRALRSTVGVSSVLVGMRQMAYVDDVLADLVHTVPQADRTAGWKLLAEAVADD